MQPACWIVLQHQHQHQHQHQFRPQPRMMHQKPSLASLGSRQLTSRGCPREKLIVSVSYLPACPARFPANTVHTTLAPSTAAYKSAGEPPISHERHQRSVTPSPSAIQPQDLADPEYSYLSRVYPMSPTNRDDPTRRRRSVSAAQPQTAGMPDTSRRQLYLSAAPTHGSPDTSPLSPTIPRKEVGSGITTGLHLNKASLESARAGTTDYAAHEPSAGSPPQALAEAAGRSVPVIDLGTTVDTEVITKEAAAVLHETIVPKVHEIREEIITRDIHKHYIIHRVLPVIDVEVLPPRHFVPAADGTLVEVSADQIPGRLGHWGIVETVTKPPGASRQSEPLPFMPVAGGAPTTISTTTTTIVHTEHGAYPRTETVIRHPPTLSTAARDAGESWPMLIDPQHYAEKHGLPVTAAPIAQGTMKPLPRVGDASAAPAASTSSYPATVPTANLATAGPLLPNPGADILPRFRDYASPAIPGAFPPPVSSTAAYNTFPEPPSHPPPPPPKD